VPHGSVLGPVLFLIYINDLDRDFASRVLTFSDDTKLPVNNQVDSIHLQKDLDTVVEWASWWQMQFNVKKCKVVHFGKENLGFTYSMKGHCLENVDCEKDLCLAMSKDLKVARQSQESYSKANRMLGLINRTIKYKNQEVLMNLFQSMDLCLRSVFLATGWLLVKHNSVFFIDMLLNNYPVLSTLAMRCAPAFSSLFHIAHAICSAAVFRSSSQFVRVIMLRHFSPF